MTTKEKEEFNNIIKDILDNNNFLELEKEVHHGISRYNHSLRVAKGVYKLTKYLHFNYKEATRAAILHDFYFNYQLEENGEIKNLVEHPSISLLNASTYYDLTTREKNIISSHMFPLSKELPRYKESFCVTLIDKIVACYEQYRFKVYAKLGVYILFVFNMLTLQK